MEEVRIKPYKNFVRILFLSDVHFGNKFCDQKEFERYIEWAKKQKGLYVITLGDLLESAIPHSIEGIMWDQVVSPQEQITYIQSKLEPLKVIAMVSGNHEDRIYLRTGIDPTELMADYLKAKYLGYGGYLRLNIGKQHYNLVLLHGSAGSQNPRYQLLKARNIWNDADVIAMGHIHKLYYEKVPYYSIENGKKVIKETILLRTGAYLRYANYAKVRVMGLPDIGSPILTFRADKHSIDVKMGI